LPLCSKAAKPTHQIKVRRQNGSYRLLAGHCRTAAAAIQAGEPLVPCLVRTDLADTPSRIAAQLIENNRRHPITTAERARACQQLRLAGLTAATIAKATGTKATGTKPAAVRKSLHIGACDAALEAAE
jgi:ParB family chromosome partitioning protein